MNRLLNYVFGFVIVYLFVLVADSGEHLQILIGLLAAMILSFLGFLISWLTLDGAQASFVTGVAVFGFGGLPAALLLLTFFITGTLLTVSSKSEYSDVYGDLQPERRKRRNGIQVWSNSFWFVFFILLWFLFRSEILLVAGMAALATATSDTWATELGYRIKFGPTYVIKGWRRVQPGTDGGVSIAGLLGGLMGGMIIGLFACWVYPQLDLAKGIFIGIVGFIGCQIDSYLGAYFQYEGKSLSLTFPTEKNVTLDNDAVNWVAIGLGSTSSLFLIHLLALT